MPRRKVLTSEEKIKIDAYYEAKFSIQKIAKKVNKSSTCVYHYLKLREKYGKNHYTGGNTKLTRRDHSRIFKEIINNNTTAAQVKRDLQLPEITRRVQQILHKDSRLK